MNRILVGIAILVLGSCGVRKDNDSIEYTEETVDAISGATEITVETEYEDCWSTCISRFRNYSY